MKPERDIVVVVCEDYEKSDDPVKTEELIFNQIQERVIDTDYVFAAFPMAWLINNKGLSYVQGMINKLEQKYGNEKLFYVCQHIQVENLNFHGKLVFTPHATKMDNFVAIPHFAASVCPEKYRKPFKERNLLLSFRGAFQTHHTRRKLSQVLKGKENCKVVDTGNWHFYAAPDVREHRANQYAKELGNTKIALCPRGTGPSTIRFWEAMASGCVPLVISDYVKFPLDKIVEWEKCIIRVKENDIDSILKKLPSEEKLEEMSKYALEVYEKYFSNKDLFKSVTMCL